MLVYLLLFVLAACGAKEEQQANREKLLEGLKDQKVKRVTEEQVHTAAYEEGNQLIQLFESRSENDLTWPDTAPGKTYLDSLNQARGHGGISFLSAGAESMDEDQSALWEAYQYSAEQGQPIGENVQTASDDYLLYTYPVTQEGELKGMWSLKLSRKELIRNL